MALPVVGAHLDVRPNIMDSKKKLREAAVERERERRSQAASKACPISRDEFSAMVDYVSDCIVDHGHKHDFAITSLHLHQHGLPVNSVLSFLTERRIKDDWDVLVSGDPHGIFGPSSDRQARMPLEKEHLDGLIDWLDSAVQVSGCDHSLRLTKSWLVERGHPTTRTIGALMALGGFCDCEVAMNIESDGIFPTTNREQGDEGNSAALRASL